MPHHVLMYFNKLWGKATQDVYLMKIIWNAAILRELNQMQTSNLQYTKCLEAWTTIQTLIYLKKCVFPSKNMVQSTFVYLDMKEGSSEYRFSNPLWLFFLNLQSRSSISATLLLVTALWLKSVQQRKIKSLIMSLEHTGKTVKGTSRMQDFKTARVTTPGFFDMRRQI